MCATCVRLGQSREIYFMSLGVTKREIIMVYIKRRDCSEMVLYRYVEWGRVKNGGARVKFQASHVNLSRTLERVS